MENIKQLSRKIVFLKTDLRKAAKKHGNESKESNTFIDPCSKFLSYDGPSFHSMGDMLNEDRSISEYWVERIKLQAHHLVYSFYNELYKLLIDLLLKMSLYEVRDPIYGFIHFNDWEKEIINHSCFQRLRRIKQLSLTDMVYPSATNTRFEHSLGVMHLTTLIYNSIIKKEKNKEILEKKLNYQIAGLEKDRQLIRIAALLHDIGHPPFSHTSEEIMPINKDTDKPHKHEEYTTAIIKGPLKKTIESHIINKNNYRITADDVAAMIEGNANILGDRLFWQVLISSQLDADKCDYLLRDSHHIGVKYGVYDHWRLINTLALGIEPETGDVILVVEEDGWHVAEALVIARYLMFTQVYFHKTRRAYDHHLNEACKAVLKRGHLPTPEKIDDYLKLDDITLLDLFKNNISNPDCNAIINRKHIKKVYETRETPTEEDEEELENKKKILADHNIWYYENRAKNLWYERKGGSEEGSKEIKILCNSGEIQPLSNLSSIVKNMGEIRQTRLYVKEAQREKAMEVLK